MIEHTEFFKPITVKIKRSCNCKELRGKKMIIDRITVIDLVPFSEYVIALDNYFKRRNHCCDPVAYYGHEIKSNLGYFVGIDEISKIY